MVSVWIKGKGRKGKRGKEVQKNVREIDRAEESEG